MKTLVIFLAKVRVVGGDGMRGRPNERRDKVFFNSFFWFLFLDLIDEYDEGFNEDEEKI